MDYAQILGQSIKIGKISLKNRIVMPAMGTGLANINGEVTPATIAYYEERARGGAGAIIVEIACVDPPIGKASLTQLAIDEPRYLAGLKDLSEAIQMYGARAFIQLHHAGRQTSPMVTGGHAPVAPSPIPCKFVKAMPEELDLAGIERIKYKFITSALLAAKAGFDGVEIHAANGYLIDQFLKTGANQRTDDYGGSIANRARLLLEVTRAIVEEIGGGRTGIRISPVTPANDVVDPHAQALFEYIVKHLAPLGLAFIHVIEGATGGPREVEGRPFDYAALKAAYRAAGGKGAWMVNNAYTRELADAALANGADIVAFGRPFIANPDLVARLKANAPLNEVNRATLYGGGAEGYTDYPALSA